MRTYKFRIKNTDGKWVYFELLKKGLWNMPDGMFDLRTLTQWTGLCDREGNEIYEGDILRIFDENYEIKINNTESKCFVNYGYPNKHNGSAPHWVEVIGNIHENPELLKELKNG